jgi:hypothetical protein
MHVHINTRQNIGTNNIVSFCHVGLCIQCQAIHLCLHLLLAVHIPQLILLEVLLDHYVCVKLYHVDYFEKETFESGGY